MIFSVVKVTYRWIVALTLFLITPFVWATPPLHVPILTYHNIDPTIPGSMTISSAKLEAQLKWIKDNGYTVIPLKELVDYLIGKQSSLPPKPVVITADDGRNTVYKYMLPL